MADEVLLVNAGTEKAVCSTKATTGQLAVVSLLAGIDLSVDVNAILENEAHIKKLAEDLCRESNIFIIGNGINHPIAQEAAIKIKEVSYIHAEAFAGSELKHGPLALIEPGSVCITIGDDTLNTAMELKARGAKIISISRNACGCSDHHIKVGGTAFISALIPIQLLAYHLSVKKGIDPDYPRNLAKSVTVK